MTPTTEQLQVLIDVYSAALKSEFAYRNQELSRMQTASILAKAELSRREVSNPHITARETIELANYMVAQSAEIERLKGLLREAADTLYSAGWYETANTLKKAGEVTK